MQEVKIQEHNGRTGPKVHFFQQMVAPVGSARSANPAARP
jgi:hypothetical protein